MFFDTPWFLTTKRYQKLNRIETFHHVRFGLVAPHQCAPLLRRHRGVWQRHDGGRFTLRLGLPPNVTASVRIPSADPSGVRRDDGQPPTAIADYPGARDSQEAMFEVGSGRHGFTGQALPA